MRIIEPMSRCRQTSYRSICIVDAQSFACKLSSAQADVDAKQIALGLFWEHNLAVNRKAAKNPGCAPDNVNIVKYDLQYEGIRGQGLGVMGQLGPGTFLAYNRKMMNSKF